jgi:hypothetical protein
VESAQRHSVATGGENLDGHAAAHAEVTRPSRFRAHERNGEIYGDASDENIPIYAACDIVFVSCASAILSFCAFSLRVTPGF